jgi:uncharacterized membrane protein YphA (DoxX/SURF4 family)
MNHSSKSQTIRKQKEPIWLIILRIALASVFIITGLMKAIDPVSFGIKVDEYFLSFGMGFMHPFSLALAFLAITAEFSLGFMLLFKIKVKLTTWGYLLFMIFFFFLTAWLAIAEHLEVYYGYNFNVVKDCGCFGEVIHMSNWGTFLKNVGLMIPTLIVFGYRKSIPDIRLTSLGQWLFAFVGVAMVFLIQFYCFRNLPAIDRGNWKKGAHVVELFIGKPTEKEILLLYQNNEGIEKLLSMEELNNIMETNPKFYDEYSYVDRIDSVIVEAVHPKFPGFSMLDLKGGDFASLYLNKEIVYMLFIHDLDEANEEAMKSKKLQNLVAFCAENDIDFVGITNNSYEDIEKFIEEYAIDFPIYYNPIDPVKGPFIVRDAIRSNPGLIILKNGVVADKKSWRNF